MSDFYKRFLADDARERKRLAGRPIFLAGFGKHPGWDDHIDDIGLETESLVIAKKLIYLDGIGGQIDRGAWDKLDATQQLSAFKHLFVWQRARQLLIGRLWSSMDGKGRTRYPMIACVHCVGLPLRWAIDHVWPQLRDLQAACVATKSPSDVRSLFQRTQEELRAQWARREPNLPDIDLSAEDRRRFLLRPELGANREGLCRILYQVQTQMNAYAPSRRSFRDGQSDLRPRQIRVPVAAEGSPQAILLWNRVLRAQLSPAAPLLLTIPDGETWLDAVVGEPSSQEFFSLRASPRVLSLASEVPYNLDLAFRQRAQEFIAAFERGTAISPKRRHRGFWVTLLLLLILGTAAVAAYPLLVQRWPALGDLVNSWRETIRGYWHQLS